MNPGDQTVMSTRVPILMYHKVAPVDECSILKGHYVIPGMFANQLRLLKALRFQTVPLNTLFEVPLPKRPISITFDDGYRNFHRNALPLLQKNDFQATVFLVANELGGTNRWDVLKGDVEEPLMTVEEIREAARVGTEFGSHTLDHVNLAEASEETAWKQIAESKETLEAVLQKPVPGFCYPYGSKTQHVSELVRRAGYRLACSTEKGLNDASTDRFALRRINIRRDTSLAVFAFKLFRGFAVG